MRQITKSVSRDLFVFMIGFGLVMGLAFPFFTGALIDVPSAEVLSLLFFSLCLGAGLLVGVFNHGIFRLVVDRFLRRMGGKTVEFRRKLEAYALRRTIDCTPESCHLSVDSADSIGALAGEFNGLVDTVFRFVDTEHKTEKFLEKLKGSSKIEDIAGVVLAAFVERFGGEGACLFGLERGKLTLLKASNVAIETGRLDEAQLFQYLSAGEPVVRGPIEAGDLVLNIGIGTLSPRHIAFIPLRSQTHDVGLAILLSRDVFKEDFTAVESRNFINQASPFLYNGVLLQRMERLAAIDELTGALNRRFGLKRLNEEFERSRRHGIPLSVAMIDIDFFKRINDTYGHPAGDVVLRTLAETIAGSVRVSDFLIRYGGEEFLIAVPGASTLDAFKLLERIRNQSETLAVQYGAHELKFTISGGVAGIPSLSIRDLEALIQSADEALYKAKEQGRNRIVLSA